MQALVGFLSFALGRSLALVLLTEGGSGVGLRRLVQGQSLAFTTAAGPPR